MLGCDVLLLPYILSNGEILDPSAAAHRPLKREHHQPCLCLKLLGVLRGLLEVWVSEDYSTRNSGKKGDQKKKQMFNAVKFRKFIEERAKRAVVDTNFDHWDFEEEQTMADVYKVADLEVRPSAMLPKLMPSPCLLTPLVARHSQCTPILSLGVYAWNELGSPCY